ncbi:MAG: hypothetical protein ACRCSF_11075 [Mycobacteriaceae bacterium]
MTGIVSAQTDGIRAFGATATTMGGALIATGATVGALSAAVLTPVFGLIGADFLAVFGTAQAKQSLAITTLGGVFVAAGEAAVSNANTYDQIDNKNADILNAHIAGMGA